MNPTSGELGPVIATRRTRGLSILGAIGISISIYGIHLSNENVTLIGLCIILGLDVKLIDQLIDDESMRPYRKFAFPLAILIPLLMGYLATIHDPVFGMVMGTAIGLLLSGKLDHPVFIMAAMGFIGAMSVFIIVFHVDIASTTIYLIPMAAFGAYGDEFGHERIGKGTYPTWIKFFFEHRFLLKTVAALSVLIGFADPIHLAGFLCWDLTYDAVAVIWEPGKKLNERPGIRTQ